MKSLIKIFSLLLGGTVFLSSLGTSQASAESPNQEYVAPQGHFAERGVEGDFEQIGEALESSSLHRFEQTMNGVDYIVYVQDDGRKIGIPKEGSNDPEAITPAISAGPALKGPWFELTTMEQEMLAVGSIAAVSTLICGATVGLGCAAASSIASAASVWVGQNGICPGEQRLLLETTWTGSLRGAECR